LFESTKYRLAKKALSIELYVFETRTINNWGMEINNPINGQAEDAPPGGVSHQRRWV
jgi:hypothetical protein